MDDGGRLMQLALTKSNISCMGTQKADQLYHLDMPNTSMWEYAFLAVHSPMLKLEQLHLRLDTLTTRQLFQCFTRG